MRMIRNAVSLLCVMALLLSLTPCALAAVSGDKNVASGEEAVGNMGMYYVGGNLTVEEGGSISVPPREGKNESTVFVTGSMDNSGTIAAGNDPATGAGSAGEVKVTVDEALNNSGTIIVDGDTAEVAAEKVSDSDDITPSLNNQAGGTITVNGGTSGVVKSEGDLSNGGEITINANTEQDGVPSGDADFFVGGNLNNTNKIEINEGKNTTDLYDMDIDVMGNLDNSGEITLNAVEYGGIRAKGELFNSKTGDINVTSETSLVESFKAMENEGTITLTGGNAEIDAGETMNNQGSIETSGSMRARISCSDKMVNGKTGILTAFGGDGAVIRVSFGQNSTSILENDGQITISSDRKARLVTDSVVNRGDISIAGDKAIIEKFNDEDPDPTVDVTNFGTISFTEKGETTNYYGVNYVDDKNIIQESALTGEYNWESGKDGNEFTLKAQDETREGETFYWKVNGVKYNPGDKFIVNSVTNIMEWWERIINNTPAAPVGTSGDADYTETVEKSREKIVKYIDGATVLDADRNPLEMDTQYYRVAKTSYNRLIVVFTWQQMAEMAEGEHLFYIVTPDGAEVEYTLTIW